MSILDNEFDEEKTAAAAVIRLGEFINYNHQKNAFILQVDGDGNPLMVGLMPAQGDWIDGSYTERNKFFYHEVVKCYYTHPLIKQLYKEGWTLPSASTMRDIFGNTVFELMYEKHMNVLRDHLNSHPLGLKLGTFWTSTISPIHISGNYKNDNRRRVTVFDLHRVQNGLWEHAGVLAPNPSTIEYFKEKSLESTVNIKRNKSTGINQLMLVMKYNKELLNI